MTLGEDEGFLNRVIVSCPSDDILRATVSSPPDPKTGYATLMDSILELRFDSQSLLEASPCLRLRGRQNTHRPNVREAGQRESHL